METDMVNKYKFTEDGVTKEVTMEWVVEQVLAPCKTPKEKALILEVCLRRPSPKMLIDLDIAMKAAYEKALAEIREVEGK